MLVGLGVIRRVAQTLVEGPRSSARTGQNTPPDPWIALRLVTNTLPDLERRFSEMPPPATTVEEVAVQTREIGQASGLIYQMVLRGIGWERLLDPRRLEADADLLEMRTMVATARRALAAQRIRTEKWPSVMRSIVLQSRLSPAEQAEVLGVYAETLAEALPLMAQILDLEEDSLRIIESMADWMESHRSHWRVNQGKLVFTSSGREKEFLGFVARVESNAARQREMQQRVFQVDPFNGISEEVPENAASYKLRSVR